MSMMREKTADARKRLVGRLVLGFVQSLFGLGVEMAWQNSKVWGNIQYAEFRTKQ